MDACEFQEARAVTEKGSWTLPPQKKKKGKESSVLSVYKAEYSTVQYIITPEKNTGLVWVLTV